MSVFIRVNNPYPDHVVDVYLDTASLTLNSGMPTIVVTAPTPTQPPATVAPPTLARPTHAPTAVAIAPTATEEPTETQPPTATVAPSETPEPSGTSTKIPTRVRRATPTPVVEPETPSRVQALLLLGALGVVGIVLAGALFAFAFVYWRQSKNEL
jgi:hypothetical protein